MSKDYPKPVEDGELREQLAAIEHERWADWQKWCHKVLRENNPSPATSVPPSVELTVTQ